MSLGVEQVSGVLAFLLNAHAQALAVLDQKIRRVVVPTARPAWAPQPDHDQQNEDHGQNSETCMAPCVRAQR